MTIKINCKYNDSGSWCNNKNIKRNIFGVRCCSLFPYSDSNCNYQEKYPRPLPPPPLPPKKRG